MPFRRFSRNIIDFSRLYDLLDLLPQMFSLPVISFTTKAIHSLLQKLTAQLYFENITALLSGKIIIINWNKEFNQKFMFTWSF